MKRLALVLCCAAAPALGDDLDDRAVAAFTAAFPEYCMGAFNEDMTLIDPPQRFDLMMPVTFSDPEKVVLWQFRCNLGAYNLQAVMMGWTEYDGIRPIPFPRPDIAVINENPDDYESPVKEIKILGWSASPVVVNPEFDASTGEMTAVSAWRGLGDASDLSVWQLVDGAFRMTRFEADGSYDGEINRTVLVNFE